MYVRAENPYQNHCCVQLQERQLSAEGGDTKRHISLLVWRKEREEYKKDKEYKSCTTFGTTSPCSELTQWVTPPTQHATTSTFAHHCTQHHPGVLCLNLLFRIDYMELRSSYSLV